MGEFTSHIIIQDDEQQPLNTPGPLQADPFKLQMCQRLYNVHSSGECTSESTLRNEDEMQSSVIQDPSQANMFTIQLCHPVLTRNIATGGKFTLSNPPLETAEKQFFNSSNPNETGSCKFQLCQSMYPTNITTISEFPNVYPESQEKQSSDSPDSSQGNLLQIQLCPPLNSSNVAAVSGFISDVRLQAERKQHSHSQIPGSPQAKPLKIQRGQPVVRTTSSSKSDFTTSTAPAPAKGGRSLGNLKSPVARIFEDLWNGGPISLPTNSWALHRVEKTGVGPLVVINEMMANDQGVPFPLKQLVINSSGNMMAIVLNQVIDVNILSDLPLHTVEALQEALKYFDQIDCEYVYVEPAAV